MAQTISHVGFLGLGRMGAPIARNVLKAGFALTVWNRSAAKADPLVSAGARLAQTPREAAAGADAVVSSLLDDRSVLEVVGGPDGILAGLPPGAVHIGTSTVSPACSRRVAALHAAHGSHFVAAPVAGRPDVAAAGKLRTFVAGDPAVIARCQPLLEAYTAGVVSLGPEPAVANSMKLAVNYMLAVVVELMGQVYAFGEKSGIDPDVLGATMAVFFGNQALQGYSDRERTRSFDEVGFALAAGLKDVDLVMQASAEARAPLPFAGPVRDALIAALANGLEHKDFSAVADVARLNAGIAR